MIGLESGIAAERAADRATSERPSRAPLVLRAVSVGSGLLLWEWAGAAELDPAFPTFSETASAAWAMVLDGSLPRALRITLEPLFLGVVVSTVLGVALGLAMGLSRFAEWLGVPVFVILQAAPLAALVPLPTFAYGIGLLSKTLVVCILALPPIVLNAYTAVRHTPASLVAMVRAFLAGRVRILRSIVLPSASPMIFAGPRLGVAAGFVGAILAELLVTPAGVGDLVSYHQSVAEYPQMYAAIVTVITFAVLVLGFLERPEHRLFRPGRRAG
ncbi:MAG: ABC transporter permease subunit [Geminicoccaceae bacterium]|nr:ABC transporter permease subunit [Geminicoccaceae bacterium]